MYRKASTPTTAARKFVVDIHLTTRQLEAFYAGNVSAVSARDRCGVRLQFPLANLRRFVGHQGVQGTFELSVDAHNKLTGIERIRGGQARPRSHRDRGM